MNQKIFKGSFVAELRDRARSGEGICDYFKKDILYPAESELESTIKVDSAKLGLKYRGKNESASNDFENAVAIYEAYSGLDETQASDPRLWVYLSHVTLRDYVQARWPLAGSCDQIMKDEAGKTAAINYIISHWFASGSDRMLRRNAIARLWWAVRLTRAPRDRDPEFFNDLDLKNQYHFTRTLLLTQDIYQQVLERGLGRDNRILITILEFIDQHKDITRDQIRDFMKELNLILSVRNLSVLPRRELKDAIFNIGLNILNAGVAA